MIIPHSRPTIDGKDAISVSRVLTSGRISQGEKVKRFEERLAKFVGVKYGIAVSSGTSAIHLALRGLDVGVGDEVILPSYVCASPYMAILHAGAKPKLVDVNISDFNISSIAVKKAVNPKTKAIIVPHMFGTPADLDELQDFGIPIMEDCAHSLGADYRKRKVGSFGEVSICSFYATKMLTTGEGGIVLTSDYATYSRVSEIREYDKKPLDQVRYNYKMSDIQAALGLSQLEKLPYFINRRREIAKIYNDRFSMNSVKLPSVQPHKNPVFYRYVVLIDKSDLVQKIARKKGIRCEKPVFKPLSKNFPTVKCPKSDYIYDHALSIPLYPSLTRPKIDYVTRSLTEILVNSTTAANPRNDSVV